MNRQNLLANQAHGAEGNLSQHLSRPDFLGWIFQVAPVSKSNIFERRKTQTTPLAARFYGPNIYSDEPLPKTNKCPPFRNSTARGTLGLSTANARPATVTGKPFRKSLWRPTFTVKGLTEANHDTSWKLAELVGILEKQNTRTQTSTFLRACRTLTAWQI